MNLSDKMPAMMDSTMAARMPAKMNSDAPPYKGEGGSEKPSVVAISRDSAQNDPEWMTKDDKGADWQTEDNKTGSAWETSDRND